MENPFHASPPASGGLLAIFSILWFINDVSLPSLPSCPYDVLRVCVSLSPNFPFYKDTSHTGLGPTLMTAF